MIDVSCGLHEAVNRQSGGNKIGERLWKRRVPKWPYGLVLPHCVHSMQSVCAGHTRSGTRVWSRDARPPLHRLLGYIAKQQGIMTERLCAAQSHPSGHGQDMAPSTARRGLRVNPALVHVIAAVVEHDNNVGAV